MTRPLLGAESGNGEGGKEGHICDVSKAVPHLPSAVLPFSKYYSIEVVASCDGPLYPGAPCSHVQMVLPSLPLGL